MAKSVKKKPVKRPAVKKPKKAAPKPKAPKPEWATKDDLRSLATKTAIGKLAAREELAAFATKEEIAKLPSKSECQNLERRVAEIEKSLQTIDKKIELLATELGNNPAALNRMQGDIAQIRENISFLENKISEKPTVEHDILQLENRINEYEIRIRNLEGVQ